MLRSADVCWGLLGSLSFTRGLLKSTGVCMGLLRFAVIC